MADTFAIRATFLVHGFACDSAFRLSDDVACRPISATDIDSFARSSFGPMDVFLNESSNRVYDTDWIFQIDANIDKQDMSSANGLAEAIDDVIVAMNLTTGGRTHFSMVEKTALSPFMQIGITRGGSSYATSRFGSSTVITSADVVRFQATYRRVCAISNDDRLAFLRLPLRRLRLSASRRHSEDHLVDCVIALENLLASDSPQMETTFRFRLRGAALLPQEFGTVDVRSRLMGRLYEARSKTVHAAKKAHGGGNKAKALDDEVANLSQEAERVLRAILLWYLDKSVDPKEIHQVLECLDGQMMSGGHAWAYPDMSHLQNDGACEG